MEPRARYEEGGSMRVGLHVGCGPIKYPSTEAWTWTNIDISDQHSPDIQMDCLQLSSKFGDNYADWIVSQHHIEHLAYPGDVMTFLKVCRHVLKPGGILRLAVPDIGKIAKAYAAGDDMTFIYGMEHKGFEHKDCPAERLLYFMRAWSHTFIPDWALMRELLNDAGFSHIRECHSNDTEIPGFTYDRFQSESLYVEAKK